MTIGDLSPEDQLRLRQHLAEPWLKLAESVGYFRAPFEELESEYGGFDSIHRYILNLAESGDVNARHLRDSITVDERSRRLDPAYTDATVHAELWSSFISQHLSKINQFQRRHYPWEVRDLVDKPIELKHHPYLSDVLSDSIGGFLSDVGVAYRRAKSTKSRWSISGDCHGRTFQIELIKVSYGPEGTFHLNIPELVFGRPLAYPFFFSGGPRLFFSAADPLLEQVERFRGGFRKILDAWWKALEETVEAADGFVRTVSRKSL